MNPEWPSVQRKVLITAFVIRQSGGDSVRDSLSKVHSQLHPYKCRKPCSLNNAQPQFSYRTHTQEPQVQVFVS